MWGTKATQKDFIKSFMKTAGEWRTRVKQPIKRRAPEVLALVPSDSHPGKYYTVKMGKDNVAYCSCKGHQYHGHCKHVDRMFSFSS